MKEKYKSKLYELYFNLKYQQSHSPAKNVIKINPNDVDYFLSPRPVNNKRLSWVLNGKWDQRRSFISGLYPHYSNKDEKNRLLHGQQPSLIEFESSEHYDSFEQHFLNGVPWEETEFYQRLINKPKINIQYGTTVDKISNRLSYNDALFSSIKLNGFTTNPYNFDEVINMIPVFIGRNGEIIHGRKGIHRFTISKLLKLNKIPVWVWGRHKEWQKIRSNIADGVVDANDEDLEDHPDIKTVFG